MFVTNSLDALSGLSYVLSCLLYSGRRFSLEREECLEDDINLIRIGDKLKFIGDFNL